MHWNEIPWGEEAEEEAAVAVGDYVGEGGGGGRRKGGKRATTSVKTMPPARSESQHGAREKAAAEAASHQSNLPMEAQGAVAHVRRPVDIDFQLSDGRGRRQPFHLYPIYPMK